MRPNWPKLTTLAQKTCTLDSFQFFGVILASNGQPFYRTYKSVETISYQRLDNVDVNITLVKR